MAEVEEKLAFLTNTISDLQVPANKSKLMFQHFKLNNAYDTTFHFYKQLTDLISHHGRKASSFDFNFDHDCNQYLASQDAILAKVTQYLDMYGLAVINLLETSVSDVSTDV